MSCPQTSIGIPMLGCCAALPPRLWQLMEQIVRADYGSPNEKTVGASDCKDWRKYSLHILGPQTDWTETITISHFDSNSVQVSNTGLNIGAGPTDHLAANPTYSVVEDTFTIYHEKWIDYLGNIGEKIQTWSDELTGAEKLGQVQALQAASPDLMNAPWRASQVISDLCFAADGSIQNPCQRVNVGGGPMFCTLPALTGDYRISGTSLYANLAAPNTTPNPLARSGGAIRVRLRMASQANFFAPILPDKGPYCHYRYDYSSIVQNDCHSLCQPITPTCVAGFLDSTQGGPDAQNEIRVDWETTPISHLFMNSCNACGPG